MAEKNNTSEALNKRDLATILEVNEKAIVIQTEVAAQYEEVLLNVEDLSKESKQGIITFENKLDSKLESVNDSLLSNHKETIKKLEDLEKDLFKIKILFIGSMIGLIAQIVQFFIKH